MNHSLIFGLYLVLMSISLALNIVGAFHKPRYYADACLTGTSLSGLFIGFCEYYTHHLNPGAYITTLWLLLVAMGTCLLYSASQHGSRYVLTLRTMLRALIVLYIPGICFTMSLFL